MSRSLGGTVSYVEHSLNDGLAALLALDGLVSFLVLVTSLAREDVDAGAFEDAKRGEKAHLLGAASLMVQSLVRGGENIDIGTVEDAQGDELGRDGAVTDSSGSEAVASLQVLQDGVQAVDQGQDVSLVGQDVDLGTVEDIDAVDKIQ